jgi:hypothetical protein
MDAFGEDDADSFRIALDIAFNRAEIRRVEKEQSDTVSKLLTPESSRMRRNGPSGSQLSQTTCQLFKVSTEYHYHILCVRLPTQRMML